MFQNCPLELRQRNQWVTWRIEITDSGRPTKVPYNPITGRMASSTDPSSWVSFDIACQAHSTGHWSGIGFMLHDSDPFVFVDLDDPNGVNPDGTPKHADPAKIIQLQAEVYQRFNGTYAEVSPSGMGLHIISTGLLPGKGRRRNSVEMYNRERFMTMTGNVYANYPVSDRQDAVTWLYNEMGAAAVVATYGGDYVDKYPDQVVIDKAMAAQNGQKFRDLAQGNWQTYYGSQSEADFALIDILAYFTQSKFQIARIFRLSALGQRDKAARDNYVMPMIDRSFDRMPPPLDIDAMRVALDNQFQAELARGSGGGSVPGGMSIPFPTSAPSPFALPDDKGADPATLAFDSDPNNPYLKPVPGLLGAIAYYIYNQAPLPVPEIALAGAIALMSGICGRSYNISGTGLNQYTLLLAGTGRGKEAIQSGIGKLMNRVVDIDGGGCPGAVEFLGPTFASGQALNRHLSKVSKSFISIQGEFDLTLKRITSRNANAGDIKFKQELLDLYAKSGKGERASGVAYADKDKSTEVIGSPAYSMLGEGTPGRFYALLDEQMITDGLLPRFTIIEYDGERVELNVARQNVQPDMALIKGVAALCGYSLMLNQQGRPIDVQVSPEADALLHGFQKTIRTLINKASNEAIEHLWNRAHLKALKLAATIAVGVNMTQPTITFEMADYALSLVKRDTSRLVAKFASGDVGDGQTKQMADLRRVIRVLLGLSDEQASRAGYKWEMRRDGVLPYRLMQSRVANIASFKNDPMKATRAVETILRVLLDGGIIQQVGATDLMSRYNVTSGRFYAFLSPDWLSE